jgi:class 3 adenylate cyclase
VFLSSVFAIDLMLDGGGGEGESLADWAEAAGVPREVKLDEVKPQPTAPAAAAEAAAGQPAEPSLREFAGSEDAVLAVVFTDVRGYTAHSKKIGDDDMSELMRTKHYPRVRALAKQRGGYVISTSDDSTVSAFRTAVDALNFSLDLSADAGARTLSTRISINTGTVLIRDNNVDGDTPTFAARMLGYKPADAKLDASIRLSETAYNEICNRRRPEHRQLRWTEQRVEMKGYPEPMRFWLLPRKTSRRRSTGGKS